MGSGVFTLVWPIAKYMTLNAYIYKKQIFSNIFQNLVLFNSTIKVTYLRIIKKEKKRLSTLGLPKRSPTLVLTQPQGAQLRSSNGIRCFHLSMADNKINLKECCRHWDFPSGPPPQYQPSLKALNFGVRMGSGVFTLVWPTTKFMAKAINSKVKKGCRHWDFPSGPPPQYQPSLKALNFGVRMGSGVFTLVWPTTKLTLMNVVDTGTSQAVPHLSTNPALRRLTSEFEWDPVFSPQYGRQQKLSTLGLPKRSPTLVLTQPQGAQLQSSNGIRCFHLSMADNKTQFFKYEGLILVKFNIFYKI
ncbi:MFS transporter (macronuclear) [Tetrahymena thermophila SB210]|uniref:MFS transporter n=1 Tax=Tetrahymena thermophila (strain SB210) TaxID=312017 RepID=I7M415_TETTS|nr:MFS transporter [Tetrahymena thermophila SB210]EAS04710.4 MFS transporter [Tetrahymena thermophila SB210]|eukprot:XP_001024955.4 MFS transporter [Tetrahymena thermophila SB210]